MLLQKHLTAGGSLLEIGNGVTTLALSSSNVTLAALIYPGRYNSLVHGNFEDSVFVMSLYCD